MITIKTSEEIEKMRQGGRILAKILKKISRAVKPGVTTLELDKLAEDLIEKYKARPSFKHYRDYPNALCVSINDEVVHGIPKSGKFIRQGDIVGLDLGIWYPLNGRSLCTDMAATVGVGKISPLAKKIIEVTKKSLNIGLEQVKPGKTTGDIGYAVQSYVEKNGFSVVRQLAGHGVGYQVHEDPRICNFGQKGAGEILKPGMTLAIEPMVTAGRWEIETLDDGWTTITRDGSLAAHFEHTVVVTEKGYSILTK